jgi:hypothetical protein
VGAVAAQHHLIWTPSVIGWLMVNVAGSSVSRILLLFVVCAVAAT